MNEMQPDQHRDDFAAWLSVVKTYALCEKALTRALAPLQLSIPKNDVLMNIARRPGLTQQRLADRLLVARSNVSMLLRDLERDGLVSRRPCATDGRVKELFLTDEGEALVARSRPVQQAVVSHMLGVCGPEEVEQMAEVMDRVAQSLRALLED
ncbi:MAG: MarR family winged helix-turn-helix transcriptional regulator [Pseudomonadota bacterium]